MLRTEIDLKYTINVWVCGWTEIVPAAERDTNDFQIISSAYENMYTISTKYELIEAIYICDLNLDNRRRKLFFYSMLPII